MQIAPTWPAELGRSSNRKLASKPLSCFNELLPKDVCYPVAEPSSGRSGSCGLQPVQHVSRELVGLFQLRLHRAKPALGKGRCNAVLARAREVLDKKDKILRAWISAADPVVGARS